MTAASCLFAAGLTGWTFFSLAQLRLKPVRVTPQPDDSINLAIITLPSIWRDIQASGERRAGIPLTPQ